MYCQCGAHIKDCKCPDADNRLKQLRDSVGLAFAWCAKCDRHYSRCKCYAPDIIYYMNGKIMENTR